MEAQKLAAIRNRENQRRSRARRKDYIQELEQRLRQYEVAGVKATTEVQAAARKVSEENIRLRSLLGICGVDSGRIEEYLRSGDTTFLSKQYWDNERRSEFRKEALVPHQVCLSIPTPNEISLRSPTQPDADGPPRVPQSVTGTTPPKDILAHSNIMLPMSAVLGNSPPSDTVADIGHKNAPLRVAQSVVGATPAEDTLADSHAMPPMPAALDNGIPSDTMADTGHTNATEQPESNIDAANSVFNPTTSKSTVRSAPPTGPDGKQSPGARDEISCLAAAEIIAGMRGHNNPERVLPELGCDSSRKCMIKNLTIFHIMDQ